MTSLKRDLNGVGNVTVDLIASGTPRMILEKVYLREALLNKPNFIKDMLASKGSFSSSIRRLYDYGIIDGTVRGYIQNSLDLGIKFDLSNMAINNTPIKLFVQDDEKSGFYLNIEGLHEYCGIPLVKEQEEIKLF